MVKFSVSRSGGTILPREVFQFSRLANLFEKLGNAPTFSPLSDLFIATLSV